LRLLLKVPLLNKSKKIPQEVYKALCLEGVSGAPNAADEKTAPKQIRMFIKLCSVFIPCECDDYYHAVAQLDVELNPEFLVAVQPYNVVRDQITGSISRRIEAATSVLLQVLYTLQRGHVQYLLEQYRIALVDTFGPAGLPAEKAARMKARTRSKLPRDRHALGQEPSKVEDQEEYDVDMDGNSSGLDQDNFRVVEDDEAHTSVSSMSGDILLTFGNIL